MNDKTAELIRLLNSEIEGLDKASREALGRANYLAGQLDAKRQIRDALLAPDEPEPEQPAAPIPAQPNGHHEEPVPALPE